MLSYEHAPPGKGYNGIRMRISESEEGEAVWNMLGSVPYDVLIEFCATRLSKEDYVAFCELWLKENL